jgi:hypothetical protein
MTEPLTTDPQTLAEFRQSFATWWRTPPVSPASGGDRLWQTLKLQLQTLPPADVATTVLDALAAHPAAAAAEDPEVAAGPEWQAWKRLSLWEAWIAAVAGRAVEPSAEEQERWRPILPRLEQLYRGLPREAPERCQLLTWLAWGSKDCLACWVRLLREDPPASNAGLRDFFAPLWQRPGLAASDLFPDLLDAIGQVDLATAVLDLANFLYRERQVRPHPASPRVAPLAQLLGDLTQQLLRLEVAPLDSGIPPDQISRVINDAVGLVSALCDFLALQGDASVVGKLYPCLEVRHRRVQLEAAYALATLGQEAGRERLVELAAEPLVRRRVLSYCQPLGLTAKIPPEYQTPAALAESELVLSLAHPNNLGLAPKTTVLLDQRRQFWPGYDQPVECFLFQFEYPFTDAPYRNVGIVGPVTHSFAQPLHALSADELYAIFAGWHVQHPEIYALDRSDVGPHLTGTLARLQRRLDQQGLESTEPRLLGHCLGNWVLVARGRKDDQPGWGVIDADQSLWLPDAGGLAGLDPPLVWYFWLGRTLLNQFNPPAGG